jgi:hypothetical protein
VALGSSDPLELIFVCHYFKALLFIVFDDFVHNLKGKAFVLLAEILK